VYYINDVADRPDQVLIRADKTVDGKTITMGTDGGNMIGLTAH